MVETRPVVGFEGLYSVTSDGRVWAEPKQWKSPRGNGITHHKGMWLKGRIDKDGYVQHLLSGNKTRKRISEHRIVAIAFIENPERKPAINHLDGVKNNNKVENLEWCTNSENSLHAIRTGLYTPTTGEKHYLAKITEEDVRDIRMFAKNGVYHKDIARVYPIKRQTVGVIVSRKNWKCVV